MRDVLGDATIVRVDLAARLSTMSARVCTAAAALLVAIVGLAGRAQEPESDAPRRQDLSIAREQYVLRTRAYPPAARQRALAVIDRALESPATLTKAALHLVLLEVSGLADNANDVLTFGGDRARPDRRLPIRVAWFPDGLIIVRATGEAIDLAGARIDAIDGVPPSELYRRLSQFAGGLEPQRKRSIAVLLESPQLLHVVGIARAEDAVTLLVTLRDGQRIERRLSTVDGHAIPRGIGPDRLLVSDPDIAERGWRAAISPDRAPLVFRDPDSTLRLEPLLDGAAIYLQVRTRTTPRPADMRRFQERVNSWLELHQPIDLVLDLRFDMGGDPYAMLAFLRALPARVTGRVYVLVGRYTLSSGIIAAAAVKKAGGDRAVLAGEAPGDRLRFWSDGGNACLPNSGFCLHYTDGMFDVARGCDGEQGCASEPLDVRVGDLQPDIAVPFTAEDYLAGRDRVLDAVLARMH
jgi:hypothetical protein